MPDEPEDSTHDAGTDPELNARARAVGLVAIRAARVEHVAAVLAVVLTGTPKAAPMLLGSGWSHIRQALNRLLDELIEEAADDADRRQFELPCYRQIVAVLKRADQLMARRRRARPLGRLGQLPDRRRHNDQAVGTRVVE